MSSIKIQIIRAEGEDWNNSALGCYVSLDNELVDVITPLNSQHESNMIKVPSKGNLKLFVKTMGDSSRFLGSILIPLDILPSKGYIWLPLSAQMSDTPLTSIPDSVQSPKILLAISNENCQSYTETAPPLPTLLSSEAALRIQELQTQLKEETQSRTTFHQAYLSLMNSSNKQLLNAEARESSMINLLEAKDREIQRLKGIVDKLECSQKTADEEKEKLLQKIEEMKMQDFISVVQRLSEELEETKKLLSGSIKQRDYLCKQLGLEGFKDVDLGSVDSDKVLIELKAEIIKYDEENRTLMGKLAQSEKSKESLTAQVFELQQILETKSMDTPRDLAIKTANIDSLLGSLGFIGTFKKAINCYYVGDKLVQLAAEENKLYVKFGGEIVTIEDFVSTILSTDETKSSGHSSHKNSSRKNFKISENLNLEKTGKKTFSTYSETKSMKKIPERHLREKSNRELSADQRKLLC